MEIPVTGMTDDRGKEAVLLDVRLGRSHAFREPRNRNADIRGQGRKFRRKRPACPVRIVPRLPQLIALFRIGGVGKRPATELSRDLTELRGLRATPFGLLAHVLTRHRAAIMARLGTEALEASDEMLNMALDYERQQGTSLFGFLRWFEGTETTLKREMEKGAGEVRLMTVHGAKGLEAPVVIIADAASLPAGGRALPQIVVTPELPSGLRLPVWIVFAVGGGLLIWIARRRRPMIGYSSRP